MLTFGELFALYYERHAKVRTKRPDNAHYFWTGYGNRWAEVLVSSLNRFILQDWVDELGMRSKSAANRAINMMAAIINWGIRRGHVQGENPCQGVERFTIAARERFLLPAEIERFKQALQAESELLRDFFWMCLLTGARRGNVQSMRWSEIDTALAIWRIPADKHKNGQSHCIPLSAAALAVLERRKRGDSDWVFLNPRTGKHLVEPKRGWKRVLKRAGLEDLRIHDLRRTVGSYLAIQGESSYVIGKALGHRDARSTAVYARLNLEPVRRAIEQAQKGFIL